MAAAGHSGFRYRLLHLKLTSVIVLERTFQWFLQNCVCTAVESKQNREEARYKPEHYRPVKLLKGIFATSRSVRLLTGYENFGFLHRFSIH